MRPCSAASGRIAFITLASEKKPFACAQSPAAQTLAAPLTRRSSRPPGCQPASAPSKAPAATPLIVRWMPRFTFSGTEYVRLEDFAAAMQSGLADLLAVVTLIASTIIGVMPPGFQEGSGIQTNRGTVHVRTGPSAPGIVMRCRLLKKLLHHPHLSRFGLVHDARVDPG